MCQKKVDEKEVEHDRFKLNGKQIKTKSHRSWNNDFSGPPQVSPQPSYAIYCPLSKTSKETDSLLSNIKLSTHITPVLHQTRKTPRPTAQSSNKSVSILSRSYLKISQTKSPNTSEYETKAKLCTPLLYHRANPTLQRVAHRNIEPHVSAFNTRVRYSEYLVNGTESNV